MPISQEGENAKIPKRDFVPGGHYAKITKRERVQEGVIAKVFEGVIVLVGDYSRGCTCQALQEGENARGAKMLGGRVSVSPIFAKLSTPLVLFCLTFPPPKKSDIIYGRPPSLPYSTLINRKWVATQNCMRGGLLF